MYVCMCIYVDKFVRLEQTSGSKVYIADDDEDDGGSKLPRFKKGEIISQSWLCSFILQIIYREFTRASVLP